MNITPSSKGQLAVNEVKLYHEVYGNGAPLVLLHGGLMTIPEMMTILAPLAQTRKVVALELQGHGRSPDTDRPGHVRSVRRRRGSRNRHCATSRRLVQLRPRQGPLCYGSSPTRI